MGTGVLIKRKIMDPVSDSRDLATKPFRRGTTVGYYYGSLVNDGLRRCQHTTETYGEHIKVLTPDTVRKCVNHLPEPAIDRYQVEHHVRIVPAQFSAM